MISTRKERISWYLYDWANSAFSTSVVTVFLGPYLTTIAKNSADSNGFISVFGLAVQAGSYFPYLVSISVILQVLILPFLGAIADFTNKKKALMISFAYLGALATMGMYFLEGSKFLFGGALFILANVCFGASIVMYNAYLPDIAEPDQRDKTSSIGWALGYIGGGVVLALNLLLYSQAESYGLSQGEAVRISLCSAGVWWGIFTIFPWLFLKIRKPNKSIDNRISYFKHGFKELVKTIKDARMYPQTLLFLIAYLLYNDGVQSVIALSAQFGQEEIGLSISVLTQVILMVQFVAFFGAMIFNYLAGKTSTKNAIIITLFLWLVAVMYAFAFLKDESGFYLLGAVIALVMGGTQALSRSLFSKLIPFGKEAEYFSLYEISEKGTSWMGPLLFGLSYQLTNSYRIAILSLAIFFIIGLILLFRVNLQKAFIDLKRKQLET